MKPWVSDQTVTPHFAIGASDVSYAAHLRANAITYVSLIDRVHTEFQIRSLSRESAQASPP